jgi:hypothetical protein
MKKRNETKEKKGKKMSEIIKRKDAKKERVKGEEKKKGREKGQTYCLSIVKELLHHIHRKSHLNVNFFSL